jgi:tetratricopeptide (TPR) repeat protein
MYRSIVAIVLTLALAACAGAPRQPVGLMDTPVHHADLAGAFLDQGEYAKALAEYNRALELAPKHAPSLAGKAVALAWLKQKEESEKAMDQAESAAETDADKLVLAVCKLRQLVAQARLGVLDRTELPPATTKIFKKGRALDERSAPLYLHAGEAWLEALDFAQASAMYTRVLELGGNLVEKARQRLDLVAKVQRAAPGSLVGKEIALVPAISRADMAALLVQELGAVKLYRRTAPAPAAGFVPPVDSPKLRYEESGPPDAAGHPLRQDIALVLELGVKGLERMPDGTFQPKSPLTRAEAAMIWEDVIVRATGDTALATQYVGGVSPFADLGSDHPAFNAAVLATTRGIMDAGARGGRFEPLGPVSGADALLSIKRLKDALNVF